MVQDGVQVAVNKESKQFKCGKKDYTIREARLSIGRADVNLQISSSGTNKFGNEELYYYLFSSSGVMNSCKYQSFVYIPNIENVTVYDMALLFSNIFTGEMRVVTEPLSGLNIHSPDHLGYYDSPPITIEPIESYKIADIKEEADNINCNVTDSDIQKHINAIKKTKIIEAFESKEYKQNWLMSLCNNILNKNKDEKDYFTLMKKCTEDLCAEIDNERKKIFQNYWNSYAMSVFWTCI